MADFTALKTGIQTYIKQNGNEEITGEKLQEILLSVVTTLGDSAINDLVTALANEVAARQNADGTLQQNITNEATARGNADTALSNRLGSSITAENTAADQIGAEAEARAAADTALLELIDGITDNIENGYVYAGIATPSSTPATGKVFYLALTAGTYTNFGSTEVSQGINILKYNGSAWSLDVFIGIDDTPTPNSPKLVKSGGAFDSVMTNGSAFDLSAHFASGGTLATYADLTAALTALNTLSASYKRGGMSVKFVHTSDNNYVQFRCKAQVFTTDITQWQSEIVDKKPTDGSRNLVESGGVAQSINEITPYTDTDTDLDIADESGNVLGRFENGDFKTKNFDSSKNATENERGLMSAEDKSNLNESVEKLSTIEEGAEANDIEITGASDTDIDFSDEEGNVVARVSGGEVETKNFSSKKTPSISVLHSDGDIALGDEEGNIVMLLEKGNIVTKNFNSDVPKTLTKVLFSLRSITQGDVVSDWNYSNYAYNNSNLLGWSHPFTVDKEYALKDTRYIVDFSVGTGAVVYIGSKPGVDSLPNETSQFSIDFANSTLNIYNKYGGTIKITEQLSLGAYTDKKYRFIIQKHIGWRVVLTMIDLTNGKTIIQKTITTNQYGLMRDKLFIVSENAVVTIYDIFVETQVGSNGNCHLIILGDSITEGYLSGNDNDTYSVRIARCFPEGTTKVSGRNGGTINGVLQRMVSEVAILKPAYVMVGIGTNNGNTQENLTQLVNAIYAIEAIPILNRIPCMNTGVQNANNTLIGNVVDSFRTQGKEIYSCMMNDATALRENIANGIDTAKFNPDKVHPNAFGHACMFKQALIDCGFLF